jgi:thiosulfate/3-mercaptopyruvate sulfurtransferase
MKFTTLVSAQQLAQHLHDPLWVVFDCRFSLSRPESGRQAYVKAHVPGARYAHLNEDLSGAIAPGSGRHPLPDPESLARKLGLSGVGAGKQVVVYDDSFGSMAARMWWLLRWLGHDAVALLDGGFPAWLKQGGEATAELPVCQPAEFRSTADDRMWVDSDEVFRALKQKGIVIDARPEERFLGLAEPFDKIAGHIPGSVNLPFEDNLDPRGGFLPAGELRALYEPLLRGTRPEAAIHMCGSGVTACHNLLALEIAGLPGGRLYAGSWSEWITDPSRPVAGRFFAPAGPRV